MTTPGQQRPRKGLARAALILGLTAAVMMGLFFVIARMASGDGLSTVVVIGAVLFYVSIAVGAVAVLVGLVGLIASQRKMMSLLGIVLGILPIALLVASQVWNLQLVNFA